jgi:hypothetical protein
MIPPILLYHSYPSSRLYSLSGGRRGSRSSGVYIVFSEGNRSYSSGTHCASLGSLSNGRRRSSSTGTLRMGGVRVGISSRGVGV